MLTGPDRFSRIVAPSETIPTPCGSSSESGGDSAVQPASWMAGRVNEGRPQLFGWRRVRRSLRAFPDGQLTANAGAGAGDASLPLKVLPAPCSNDLDQRTHGLSVAGDAVLNPRRDLRINSATDESLVLQTAERRGQDLVGNLGH